MSEIIENTTLSNDIDVAAETKKPNRCHRCQSDLVTTWQMVSWRAGCRNCGIQTAGHDTEEAAIADWNQSYTSGETQEKPAEADSNLNNAVIDESMRSHCQYCGMALVNRTVCKNCVFRTELKKGFGEGGMPML
jgi:hypothetical protein